MTNVDIRLISLASSVLSREAAALRTRWNSLAASPVRDGGGAR